MTIHKPELQTLGVPLKAIVSSNYPISPVAFPYYKLWQKKFNEMMSERMENLAKKMKPHE